MQQQGVCMMLALLPIAVQLLSMAAEQLIALQNSADRIKEYRPRLAYGGTLKQLRLLMTAAGELLDKEQGVGAGAQPAELAAAAEAALRLMAQAAVLDQPLKHSTGMSVRGIPAKPMAAVRQIVLRLLAAVEEEASAAPEPGRVRPSLQAQLRLVHTACKFVRAALVPGAAASIWGSSGGGLLEEEVFAIVRQILVHSNLLLLHHLDAGAINQGHAPLTATEKRALICAALAQGAAGSAAVRLLPEGPARDTQQTSNLLQLCRFLAEPEVAGALLAQHAELAEQLLTGLAAAMKEKPFKERAEGNRFDCSLAVQEAVRANRRLGPMMLGGAAGEALEVALQQSLQGSALEVAVRWGFWISILAALMRAAQGCFGSSGRAAAAQLLALLESPAGVQGLPQEGWEALDAVQAAADEWLAQGAQQQWRQEQLLLCAKAAATRACSNLACTNLVGASEAGLKARLCSGCRCVRYCSTACQRADWDAGHKAVCKRLQARQAGGG